MAKQMYKNAIVRIPGQSLIQGITTAHHLGHPDYPKALEQHRQYIAALESCGVKVTVLPAEEQFPDSVFVEDTAVLTPECAIVTCPGASSRQGEEKSMAKILREFYSNIEYISPPGTLDGGDVMQVEKHFFVGLSSRTNEQGVHQFGKILNHHGYSLASMKLDTFLHLKTGVAYLGNNTLLTTGELNNREEFSSYQCIIIPESESYAANSIRVNQQVLIPLGFPQTAAMIKKADFDVIEVDVSEFRKLDGGLSCLSLRF